MVVCINIYMNTYTYTYYIYIYTYIVCSRDRSEIMSYKCKCVLNKIDINFSFT